MAARARTKRDDDLEPDPSAAVGDDELDGEDLETDDVGDVGGADGDFDELESVEDLGEREADEADQDDEDDDLDSAVQAVATAVVEFDDDRTRPSVADEDDEEEVEGLRDGEFVCRSCFLARRESQLADPDRLLCRDCA